MPHRASPGGSDPSALFASHNVADNQEHSTPDTSHLIFPVNPSRIHLDQMSDEKIITPPLTPTTPGPHPSCLCCIHTLETRRKINQRLTPTRTLDDLAVNTCCASKSSTNDEVEIRLHSPSQRSDYGNPVAVAEVCLGFRIDEC
ncbi:hypothetical protein CRM22_000441 [Opisthorchis felineus]|uniref:Uncharacterized protein n=1 Tax=Opisthorchis felineus TaxID=147828 RepID=A0A4S2MJL5_OPIFE|nr:hypothetical protein CRM22_000441 [Opisthorchis felineus]